MFTVQSLAELLHTKNPDLPIMICDADGNEYVEMSIVYEDDKVLLIPCEPEDE